MKQSSSKQLYDIEEMGFRSANFIFFSVVLVATAGSSARCLCVFELSTFVVGKTNGTVFVRALAREWCTHAIGNPQRQAVPLITCSHGRESTLK
jgi:hypothetical protein